MLQLLLLDYIAALGRYRLFRTTE